MRPLAALAAACCVLGGCSSSGTKHATSPLCTQQPPPAAQKAGGGAAQLNPARGLLVTIDPAVEIRDHTSAGCQVRLSYAMTSTQPVLTLELSGRLGSTTRPGEPALHDTAPGRTRFAGTLTLPLDGAATSAAVKIRIVRFAVAGRPPAGSVPGPSSVTVQLRAVD